MWWDLAGKRGERGPEARVQRVPLTQAPPYTTYLQVGEVFDFEFKVAAAALPNTCADSPAIGGPEPTPAELASLLDLFQVGPGVAGLGSRAA